MIPSFNRGGAEVEDVTAAALPVAPGGGRRTSRIPGRCSVARGERERKLRGRDVTRARPALGLTAAGRLRWQDA